MIDFYDRVGELLAEMLPGVNAQKIMTDLREKMQGENKHWALIPQDKYLSLLIVAGAAKEVMSQSYRSEDCLLVTQPTAQKLQNSLLRLEGSDD
jgi:hypothetical protein